MILIIDDSAPYVFPQFYETQISEAQTVPGPREAMDVVRAEAPALISNT